VAKMEMILSSARAEEVSDTIRAFPEVTSEEVNGNVTEFYFQEISPEIGDLAIDVEEFDDYTGYMTSIDVYGTTWKERPERVNFFFALLSQRTDWELGSRFDANDRPLVHRHLKNSKK